MKIFLIIIIIYDDSNGIFKIYARAQVSVQDCKENRKIRRVIKSKL
jgi:hypothetical protein